MYPFAYQSSPIRYLTPTLPKVFVAQRTAFSFDAHRSTAESERALTAHAQPMGYSRSTQ